MSDSPSFSVVKELFREILSSGDVVTITICSNSSVRWTRIERTAPNGSSTAVNLPTRIVSNIIFALMKAAGREVSKKYEKKREAKR